MYLVHGQLYNLIHTIYNSTLQSLTGKYRGLQGNSCNENRDPAMITGVPCNENRVFPVGIYFLSSSCSSEIYPLTSSDWKYFTFSD